MSASRFEHAVVVLGMHRSGTSALAGALGLVGFQAPRTLLPASEVNERGFYESLPIKELNDQVFADLATTWHGLRPIHSGMLEQKSFDQARRRVERVLTEEFDAGCRPLIKDPRLCRLLPLWKPVLERLTATTAYAFTVRDPLEVAQSLARRNDFGLHQGLALWARYYLDAEAETRGSVRAFVSYVGLLDDPQPSLKRIADELGLWIDLKPIESAGSDFLSDDLRHHRSPGEQTLAELQRLPGLSEIYRIFGRWSAGDEPLPADYETLDSIREDFDRIGDFLTGTFESGRLDRKRLAASKAQAEKANNELDRAQRTIENLGELQRTIQQQAGTIDNLVCANEERFRSLEARLNSTARQEQESKDRLARTLEALQSEIRSRAALDRTLSLMITHNDGLKAQLAILEKENEAAKATIRKTKSDLSEAQAEISAAKDEFKKVKRKYRAIQEVLERERQSFRGVSAQLQRTQASLAQYERSVLWRSYLRAERAVRKFGELLERSEKKRRHLNVAALEASKLFDRAWYLDTYPDVAASGMDPVVHYLEFGWREGRDPSPQFSTTAYLKANADVAAHGANPLLHYVEYGHFEGRRAPEHAAPAVPVTPQEEFGPAGKCKSFPIENETPVYWRSSAQLGGNESETFLVTSQAVARYANQSQRARFEAAVDRLTALSSSEGKLKLDTADEGDFGIADIWHAGHGLTRIRCSRTDAEGPFVVRVLQYSTGQGLRLIGENLVQDVLDLTDARPSNPYFPLMFVFVRPDGELAGWRTLAFPSLCRGGLHYPEFLAVQSRSSQDRSLLEISETLTRRLAALRGDSAPLVESIDVDLQNADGTHPMFHAEFQAWLSDVMRVTVLPLTALADPDAKTYLADTVRLDLESVRQEGAASLRIASDMIPSISVLVASAEEGAATEPCVVAIAGQEPSQPSTLIIRPAADDQPRALSQNSLPALASRGGQMLGLGGGGICAVRMPQSRPLSDAELLVPVAPPALPVPGEVPAMTWLIWPEPWSEGDFAQSLESLRAQTAQKQFRILLIGNISASKESLARQIFSERVTASDGFEQALSVLDTPLVAYLGPGVILHDVRLAAILARELDDPMVTTSSAVLVSVEKRGKGWTVSPADAGTIQHLGVADRSVAAQAGDSALFWRESWSVSQPPRDLWLSRSVDLRKWGEGEAARHHLCTSQVAASYRAPRPSGEAPLIPPESLPSRAMSTELLVG